MNLLIGIGLLIAFIIFLVYASISVKHAARFRYLSSRTVYLTLFFSITSTLLIGLILGLYIWMLLN